MSPGTVRREGESPAATTLGYLSLATGAAMILSTVTFFILVARREKGLFGGDTAA